MAEILSRVPYMVTLSGSDRASGKPIRNILYYRNGASVSGVLYGQPQVGTSQDYFLTALLAKINTYWAPVQPDNVRWSNLRMEALIGRQFVTPQVGISAVAFGATVAVIATTGPHGLTDGGVANITGITTPAALNGSRVAEVVDANIFEVPYAGTPPWSGDGAVQTTGGTQEWILAARFEKNFTVDGSVNADALPLFSTASVRRLNSGVGRAWRSRISVSPLPETHWTDGTMQAAGVTPWNDWQTQMLIPVFAVAGATNAEDKMYPCAVARSVAFTLASPFVASDTWCRDVTAWDVRENNGSLIRRKPRLTQSITPIVP